MIDNLESKLLYYNLLDERQKRLYLALEAKLLGRSGVRLVSEAFQVDPRTIRKAKKELEEQTRLAAKHIRKEGGGRKKR
jgi:hypothetical protein